MTEHYDINTYRMGSPYTDCWMVIAVGLAVWLGPSAVILFIAWAWL